MKIRRRWSRLRSPPCSATAGTDCPPPYQRSNGCGPKDGWKVNGASTSAKFATKTNSVPASCTPGSANGIVQAQAQDKTAKSKGATFKIQGKNGSYAPAVGPFRMTVVLGDSPAGLNGQCATHTFAAADCTLDKKGKTLKCK